MTRHAWRGAAMAIALAALVDPVLSIDTVRPPVVALAVADGADRAGAMAAAALERQARVGRWPVARPDAIVAVGQLPPATESPIPGVLVDVDTGPAAIRRVDVPARALVHERVPVDVVLDRDAASPLQALSVELLVDGALADRRTLPAGEDTSPQRLSFVPGGPGVHLVRVRVLAGDGVVTSAADALVSVDEARWRVFVHDARPSWPSTFVRRALEADRRFDVRARVSTSGRADVSSGGGGGLSTPGDAHVVVVGVPGELTPVERRALDDFMRRRGGSVVYLFDQVPAPGVAGVESWHERLVDEPQSLVAPAGGQALRSAERAEPNILPAASEVLAAVEGTAGTVGTAVVWQRPVGRGLLVVNGALDAWQHRGEDEADFDAFWRETVASAAARVPAPVSVELDRVVVRPGSRVRARVALADVARDQDVSAMLVGDEGRGPVRLWPTSPGSFEADVTVPSEAGHYRLVVTTPDAEGSAGVAVAEDASVAVDRRSLVGTARALGLRVVPLSRVADPVAGLAAMLGELRPAVVEVTPWRPMRSAWWIVPFALLLGIDWWQRRRP